MFCKNCGKEIMFETDNCVNCGSIVKKQNSNSFAWALLGFFFPYTGLALFFVWKKDRPSDANAAGIAALIMLILLIVLNTMKFMLNSYYFYW